MPERQTYRVGWRPQARRDLRGIIQYIANDSKPRSEIFGKTLRNKVNRLAQFPGLGRLGRVNGTRELVTHPNYIVIYRVLEDAGKVQILRIKHTAQQIP